jgi:hypothetical protein
MTALPAVMPPTIGKTEVTHNLDVALKWLRPARMSS